MNKMEAKRRKSPNVDDSVTFLDISHTFLANLLDLHGCRSLPGRSGSLIFH